MFNLSILRKEPVAPLLLKEASIEDFEEIADDVDYDEALPPEVVTFKHDMPEQIFIGYYAHIKKAELLRYLRGYSTTHCKAPKTARFQIRKFMQGFLYELHDGGTAGGVLSGVIAAIESGGSPVIATSGRKIRIVQGSNGPTAFILKEDDTAAISAEIKYKDKLTRLTPSGMGLFACGAIIFLAGLSTMAAGSITQFTAAQAAQVMPGSATNGASPVDALAQLQTQMPGDGQYIDRLEFKDGKWEVVFGSIDIEPQEKILDPGEAPPLATPDVAVAEMRQLLIAGENR